jgi:hypothetical protein
VKRIKEGIRGWSERVPAYEKGRIIVGIYGT